MKVLVTGAAGQLGRALVAAAPAGCKVVGCARADLDITDRAALQLRFAAERPELVINLAAFTAVDKAERRPEVAYAVNAEAAGLVAEAAARAGARLVHISTDYVFSGEAAFAYVPTDPVSPPNVYGASKAAGEAAVRAIGGDSLIVRTAWLFGPSGRNFMTAILEQVRAGARVRAVTDQTGSPTSVLALAPALWDLALSDAKGTVHAVNAGIATRFDLAAAIAEGASRLGLATAEAEVLAVETSAFPSPARRPAWSVLDGASAASFLRRPMADWRMALDEALGAYARHAA